MQLTLALGTFEWIWTILVLAQARVALGQPWLRMTLILDDDGTTKPSNNPALHQVIDRALELQPSRRRLLKAGFGAAALPFLGGLAACGGNDDVVAAPAPAPPAAATPERMFGFSAVASSNADAVVVPAGYVATAFLPWGEPIHGLAPDWKPDASNTAADQEQQIGDNHDGMHFFGFNAAGNGPGDRSDEGLLVVNHEYINPEYFCAPDSDPLNWLLPFTYEKARKGQAGHGVSVVHIKRGADGNSNHLKNSPYNRRIHGNTPIAIPGPAAGHARRWSSCVAATAA